MYPQSLSLEITYECNGRCSYCCSPREQEVAAPLTERKVIQILEGAASLGVKAFEITGGEPFLRLELLHKIRHATRGQYLCVLSNGILLSDPAVIYFAGGLEELRVSLDELSGLPRYRLGTDPERIFTSLRAMREIYPDLRISVTTMLSADNVPRLDAMYRSLAEADIDRWMLGFVSNRGRAGQSNTFVHARIPDAIAAVAKVVEQYLSEAQRPFLLDIQNLFYSSELDNGPESCEVSMEKHPCSYSRQSKAFINFHGQVLLCPDFEEPLADLRDYGSLQEAIEAGAEHPFLQMSMNDVADCRACRYFKVCGTGCRANAIHWTGSVLNADVISCSLWPWRERLILPLLPDKVREPYQRLMNEAGFTPTGVGHVSEIPLVTHRALAMA